MPLPDLSSLTTAIGDCADDDWPHSTGACVILFAQRGTRPCIVVFEDKSHAGRFEHAGGGCDPKEDPAIAAARELREESGNLFHIPAETLRGKPMAQKGEYRAFAVKVKVQDVKGNDAMSRGDFTSNMTAILKHKGKVPTSWKEMRSMTYIELATLLNTGLLSANLRNGDLKTFDVDSKPITLRDRDAAILRTLWLSPTSVPGPATPTLKLRRRTGYDVVKANGSWQFRWGTRSGKAAWVPEELYKDEIDRKFLNGTTWYKN
tara:strand:+ start:404 stop:1189 length:786 start_codon:yes stop_codon:yes gene_type:complete